MKRLVVTAVFAMMLMASIKTPGSAAPYLGNIYYTVDAPLLDE